MIEDVDAHNGCKYTTTGSEHSTIRDVVEDKSKSAKDAKVTAKKLVD